MTAAEPAERPRCPVCRGGATRILLAKDAGLYWRCETCLASYLDPCHRLPPEAELAHYRHHRNDPADAGYRAFLARLAVPLLERLAPHSAVLDYGCGPGPALAQMLGEAGHEAALYDPFFAPDRAVLARRYDAITCTEAVEHFFDPAAEFDRLGALLRPGGWLAVMTCFQTDDARFEHWHYRLDPTHVVFYREATLAYVATERGWSFASPAKDIALMQMPNGG